MNATPFEAQNTLLHVLGQKKKNSLVFYKPMDAEEPIPGRVERIFSFIDRGPDNRQVRKFFFAVCKSKANRSVPADPFADFSDFGAGLWSKDVSEELDIIPDSQEINHAVWRKWN